MAGTLTDADIQDLVVGTLKELGKLKFQQIAQRLQDYEVMGRLMRRDRVRFDSGNGIQRTIMVDHSGSARDVGLYEQDTVNVADVLAQINIPWRHTTANYAYERRELTMNSGSSRIVSLLQVRRTDAMISLAEHMEARFWSAPTDSTDSLRIFGVPYWVVPHASAGFNGGNASGFTSGPGNLDSTTYTRWKNYTGTYSAVSKDDLIAKLRTAKRKIGFKSPVSIPDFRRGRGDQYRLYMGESTLAAMEQIGEQQNENLGRDLAPMDDMITFKRHPLVWVPYLDDNAAQTGIIYMLNFAYFHPVFLRGEYLRETEPTKSPTQHCVWVVHVDLTWNVLCTDRRRQAVLYQA